MDDDLEVLMHIAEGEGPSREFRAKLRERIVAESPSVEIVPAFNSGDTGIERERRNDRSMRTRLLVAAIAASFVVIVGILVAMDTAPERIATEEPAFSTADAELITDEYSSLDADRYLVDTVGTPFTITLEQPQFVWMNDEGRVRISHPDSQDFDDRQIAIMRLTALADPAQPFAQPDDPDELWPADDFGGWLDNVSDRIVSTNRKETTLGGLEAIQVDLELGATTCEPSTEFCALFGTNRLIHNIVLLPGSKYRVWVVDQGDEDPLAVVVAIDRPSDDDWFDSAETILSTLAFGKVGPNPILETSVTPTELPFLGGISIEPEPPSFALQDPGGFGRIPLSGWEADTKFLANPRDLAGKMPATADELVAGLRSVGVEVSEGEAMSVGGLEARTFDIVGGSSDPVLVLAAPDERAWRVPAAARLWLIEHPDRGVLMITAEVTENVDIALPLVIAQTEKLIGSLEFVELG